METLWQYWQWALVRRGWGPAYPTRLCQGSQPLALAILVYQVWPQDDTLEREAFCLIWTLGCTCGDDGLNLPLDLCRILHRLAVQKQVRLLSFIQSPVELSCRPVNKRAASIPDSVTYI